MKNILNKYIEEIATKKAKAIDDFIKDLIPTWKRKIMLKYPLTKRLFRYDLHQTHLTGERLGSVYELFRCGKKIGTLTINITINDHKDDISK